MLDQIIIRDLAVHFQVGVSDAERSCPQRLLLTLELAGDFSAAAVSDDLGQALDYDALVRRLLAWGEGRSWRLLEALAAEVARLVLAEFKPAWVTVEIKKFALPQAAYVAVRLTRPRTADPGSNPPVRPG